MYKKIFFFSLVLSFGMLRFSAHPAFANNLNISNVSLEDRDSGADTVVLEFDISWENSWRDNINYDAVWVFVKACEDDCLAAGWEHANLETGGMNPSDTSTGTSTESPIEIFIPGDKVGAFIQRSGLGTGNVNVTNVRLNVDYSSFGAADTDQIQLKIFGIEMVYIPTGDFYIGDGNGAVESTNAFHAGTGSTAQQITTTLVSDIRVDANSNDDDQIEITGIGIDGDGGLDTDDDTDIDNGAFPTGYQAFYLMKYEMSQGQYKDFLNTLSQAQQNNRVTATLTDENAEFEYVMASDGATTVTKRNSIKAGNNPANGYPYVFGCDLNDNEIFNEADDGQWIAMNYLEWVDAAAYADWAGLRPMTELEFEKAARGTNDPIYGEYAWGTSTTTVAENITNSGQNSEGVETIGEGLANYSGSGDAPWVPIRVGFAAEADTTRLTSGAGYYGNMNLSDNLREEAVTVGTSEGRAFQGSHGDGALATATGYEGNATNSDWPGINSTASYGITGTDGIGFRGTDWDDGANQMRLSDRYVGGGDAGYLNRRTKSARFARTEGFVECGDDLYVTHYYADGVAPSADTTIRYGTVSTSLSGGDACWITQNLGASQQATSATDATDASAGWYFQFNRKQGYVDGPTPSWTITSISEDSDWLPANDPCTLELGEGWRLPTSTEWTAVDSNGTWGDYDDTYASVLKLHVAGYLDYSDGSLGNRGSSGNYWCSTQDSSTFGYNLFIGDDDCSVYNNNKAYGFSGRCVKD